jgi:hypothetical protein
MRADSIGLFWQDEAKVKPPKKEKIKKVAPFAFWLEPGYIPPLALEEAQAYHFELMNDIELLHAYNSKNRLVYDIEVYPNYCLFSFKNIVTGKLLIFELDDSWEYDFDHTKLKWVLENFTLITFNGEFYDIPISALAVTTHLGTEAMWEATVMLIQQGLRPKDIYKYFKVEKLKVDQIDVIQLTAQAPSLKKCAARLHAPKLQDLPFKPGSLLTPEQIVVLRRYNINDLDNTQLVYESKKEEIELREKMSKRFKVDLRSDSDAQMAEAIINVELKRITGRKYIQRTKIPPGTGYKFQTPKFIKYYSPLMQHVLDVVQNATFMVNDWDGGIILPKEIDDLELNIAGKTYKFGIGGLHSQEKSVAYVANDEYFIADTDATSYYPFLILNAGLTPENLGQDFLIVYNGIVVERVNAKEAGEIVTALSLKIVVNGTFGKLGSMWSIVYAPNLMMQTTVTGQLSILMLIERFELSNIEVTSANTDGVVARCKRSMESEFNAIVKQWELETGFKTEETRYTGTYNRDVNNYIAVYEKAQKGELFKTKGVYAKTSSQKNAVNEICIKAIKEYMASGKSVTESIYDCKQISMFTTMREVKGGAVKGDIYLGKVCRWYYSTEAQGDIIYALTGNKVARSDGAKPLMDLPKEFPNDINYSWYIDETYKMLEEIGYTHHS